MVNLSLSTGIVSPPLRSSRVIPIYKEGDKNYFGNFRPISLISAFGKLIEKIVAKQLTKFLENNNLLYKHQYGFRRFHDCQQPLICFSEKVRQSLDSKGDLYSLSVFIDLRKAFDTIPLQRLSVKMKSDGIEGKVLSWIQDFLTQYS